ncbi:anthranilate synthase component II (glutamine amido-transferase) [Streptococcus pneumoniae]|nr:anthranilate synthase component II (glutamine amido-transferase) [Streptococcus pneumoniae]
MILLIDNYDSFTYNLAQYIGNFAEVQVLRNDDSKLYEEAEKADGLVFSPGPGWPVDAGKMEDMIRDFAGKKPILGICLGHQAIAEVFGGKLGLAPKVMLGNRAISTLKRHLFCIKVLRKDVRSCVITVF